MVAFELILYYRESSDHFTTRRKWEGITIRTRRTRYARMSWQSFAERLPRLIKKR